jgi:thiol-disulfide isomerase/thioredoxin
LQRTGNVKLLITFHLLKTHPDPKTGLFLLFFPFLLLSLTILYGYYMKLTMPGIIDYLMYLVATTFAVLMYRNKSRKWIFYLFSIVYVLLVYNYDNLIEMYYSLKEKNIHLNQMVPVLHIEDKDGKKVIIENNNKILVIDLWSLSCSNCIKSFPKFEQVKNDFKEDKEVVFLSINIYQSKAEIEKSEKIIKDFTFTNYYSNTSLFETLNFNSVPNYMIVGKDGRIKYFGNLNVATYENYNNMYKLIENEK